MGLEGRRSLAVASGAEKARVARDWLRCVGHLEAGPPLSLSQQHSHEPRHGH